MSHPSDSSPSLGVAIVARNAADTLRRTLTSVAEMADEVIVLDTGSEDDTAAVAEKLGAQLIRTTWNDDFSTARNECLSHVSCDWVLWLDAGETLATGDVQELSQFVQQRADPRCAYLLLIQSSDDTTMDAEQIGSVRLVPVRPELTFAGRVRESLLPAINATSLSVEGLPYRILSNKALRTPEQNHEIGRRNLKLADLQIASEGPTARMLNCQGEAFQLLGDIARSLDLYKQALELSDAGSTDMLEAYAGVLSALDHDPQAVAVQLEICLKALETFPVDAQLLCAMASYLQKQGRLDLAARSYRTAFQFGQVQPQLWHVGAIHEIAAVCCCLALQLQDQNEEAEQVLLESLKQRPQSERLRRHLITLHIKQGRREEAIGELVSLPNPPADASSLRGAVRGACLAAKRDWQEAIPHLAAAYEAGFRDPVCLRWLAVSYLSLRQIDEGRAVLNEWHRIDPHDVELNQYLELLKTEPAPETQVSVPAAIST